MTKALLHRGYVALITALALSAMLTTLTVVAAAASTFSRHQILDFEDYIAATHQARACAALVLVHITQDPFYHSHFKHEKVQLGDKAACFIDNVNSSTNYLEIGASSRMGNSVRHLIIRVKLTKDLTPRIEQWLEL